MLYPPILSSSLKIFTGSTCTIEFSLSSITSPEEVKHIGILIVLQSNNKSIAKTDNYPDGVIYKEYAPGMTSVSIDCSSSSSEVTNFQKGELYKVLLRFGSNELWTGDNFPAWRRTLIANNVFSEWSNVTIVKGITALTLSTFGEGREITGSITTIPSLSPTFTGVATIPNEDKEIEEQYKFDLYNGTKLLETTDWLFHDINKADQAYFLTHLNYYSVYQIQYSIKTVNDYKLSTSKLSFLAVQSTIGDLEDIEIEAIPDKENGCMRLYIKDTAEFPSPITADFVISRAVRQDNYTKFTDIKFLTYIGKSISSTGELCFSDYTIESGVYYKYAILKIGSSGTRTNPNITDEEYLYFDYGFLYRDNKQFRIMFNLKMNSFKYTTLRAKLDTLGDKYPHLVLNGNAYYAEFPISGLITYQENADNFFAIDKNDREGRFEARAGDRKLGEEEVDYTISTDLLDSNIYVERKFRETVELFLNNFEYKLYKSPTEGNIIVNLINVTMTPRLELGRMLYEFNATAYLMAESSIDNYLKYGIINIGNSKLTKSIQSYESFGLVIYSQSVNIWNTIQELLEISSDIYESLVDYLTSFWIEPLGFSSGLIPFEIGIDNQTPVSISLLPNKIYTFSGKITSLSTNVNDTIYINYTCMISLSRNNTITTVVNIDIHQDFGQVIVNDADEGSTTDLLARIKTNIENLRRNDNPNDSSDKEYIINAFYSFHINAALGTKFIIDGEEVIMGAGLIDTTNLYYYPPLGKGKELKVSSSMVGQINPITIDYIFFEEIRTRGNAS